MAEPLARCPYCPWEAPRRQVGVEILDDMDIAEHLVVNHTMRSESLREAIGEQRRRYVAAPRQRRRAAVARSNVEGTTDG